MSYTKEELKRKLLEMYPEIKTYGLSTEIGFDEGKNAWGVYNDKGFFKGYYDGNTFEGHGFPGKGKFSMWKSDGLFNEQTHGGVFLFRKPKYIPSRTDKQIWIKETIETESLIYEE